MLDTLAPQLAGVSRGDALSGPLLSTVEAFEGDSSSVPDSEDERCPSALKAELSVTERDREWLQKPCKYIDKYPDPPLARAQVREEWQTIKHHLATTVAAADFRPGFSFWIERLNGFLDLWGLHITREDHIGMVRLLCEVAVMPDLESSLCSYSLNILAYKLLPYNLRHLLEPQELVINWRPWYDLWAKYTYSYHTSRFHIIHDKKLGNKVSDVVYKLNKFFPPETTREVLEEAQKYLISKIWNCAQTSLSIMSLFLPVVLPPEVSETSGYGLWLDKIMALWEESVNAENSVEQCIITLLSHLCFYNIGYIDWEPHMPKIFTRILRFFRLNVSLPRSAGVAVVARGGSKDRLPGPAFCNLIVCLLGNNSSAMKELKSLFRTLENYFHPSNMDMNMSKTLCPFMAQLLQDFQYRVTREQKEHDWLTRRTPKAALLTESDVTEFVSIVSPSALLSVYMKLPGNASLISIPFTVNPANFVQKLAFLSPHTILPELFELVYTSLGSLTEPHQVRAGLYCLTHCASVIISEHQRFPGGRLKLLQIMTELLPAFDANDSEKLLSAIGLISAILYHTPLVDCSQAGIHHNDLSEEELELCHFSANFEFIAREVTKKFLYVINSIRAVDNYREGSSSPTGMVGWSRRIMHAITICMDLITTNASEPIAKAVIEDMFAYASTTIMSVNEGLSSLATLFLRPGLARPDIVRKLYVPRIHSKIKELATEHNLTSETEVDKELLWYSALFEHLHIISGIESDSEAREMILECVDLLLRARHTDLYTKASRFSRVILQNLLAPKPKPAPASCSSHNCLDLPLSEFVPIIQMGKSTRYKDVKLEWFEDKEVQIKFADLLVDKFLMPHLEKIRQFSSTFTSESRSLDKEELLRTLHVICSMTSGLLSGTRGLDQTHVLVNTSSSCDLPPNVIPDCYAVNELKISASYRKEVTLVVHELLQVMMSSEVLENEVKSLRKIAVILGICVCSVNYLHDCSGPFRFYRDVRQQLLGRKRASQCKLQANYLIFAELGFHYQMCKTRSYVPGAFGTETENVAGDLWRLATSRYPAVRSTAQRFIELVVTRYKHSFRVFVPRLCSAFTKPESPHHLKGALHVALHHKDSNTLLDNKDFEQQKLLWISLLNCEANKKSVNHALLDSPEESVDGDQIEEAAAVKLADDLSPEELKKRKSIAKLISAIFNRISSHITHLGIFHKVSDGAKDVALSLLPAGVAWPREVDGLGDTVTDQQREGIVEETIEQLCQVLEDRDRHVTVHQTATRMLNLVCLRYDWPHPPPIRVVQVLFAFTLDESSAVRNMGYKAMKLVLELTKVKAVKLQKSLNDIKQHNTDMGVEFPAYCGGGPKAWTIYSPDTDVTLGYDQRYFIDNSYEAYNSSTDTPIGVYAPTEQQFMFSWDQLDRLNEVQRGVVEWLRDPHNRSQFCRHLSGEEKRSGVNAEDNSRERENFTRYKIWQFILRLLQHEALPLFAQEISRIAKTPSKPQSQKDTAAEQTPLPSDEDQSLAAWPQSSTQSQSHDAGHRFLAEFTCAAIHASKLWRYSQVEALRDALLPVLEQKLMGGLDDNTVLMWANCLRHAVKDTDPLRVKWFLEWLMGHLSRVNPHEFTLRAKMLFFIAHDLLVSLFPDSGQLRDRLLAAVQPLKASRFTFYRRRCADSLVHCMLLADPSLELRSGVSGSCEEWRQFCLTELPEVLPIAAPDFQPPPKDDVESDAAVMLRLANTISRVVCFLYGTSERTLPEFYSFLPVLASVEGVDADAAHVKMASHAVQVLAFFLITPACTEPLERAIKQMATGVGWRCRRLALVFVQQLAMHNLPLLRTSDAAPLLAILRSTVLKLLKDEKLEVRELAGLSLCGLLRCGLVAADNTTFRPLLKLCSTPIADVASKSPASSAKGIVSRHAGVLGLSACVKAVPYSVPDWLPGLLMTLVEHLHDPTPVEASVRSSLMDFKRTHHDNWQKHKLAFSEDQINTLNDILISPSYYI